MEDNYSSTSGQNGRPVPATKDEADPNKLRPLYEDKGVVRIYHSSWPIIDLQFFECYSLGRYRSLHEDADL